MWDTLRKETKDHPLCGKIRSLIPEPAAVLDGDETVRALDSLLEDAETEVHRNPTIAVLTVAVTVRSGARWASRGSNRSSALCSTRLMR